MSEEIKTHKRIHVLDKKVSELIAAGEVVERPASAVKELLENAVDAGASMITLEIKNGGISFIRVTDNGCGIERGDTKIAFLRHATSKVQTEDDLSCIGTLGFRGEALASIAAVSKTELITRTDNELAGTHIELLGGEIIKEEDAGCARGTTIIVRELFYNTPARMKFLKKNTTEGNAVAAVAQRIALSHPEISFRFIKDGHEDLHTPGDNKLLSAIHSVLGRDFARNLFLVNYTLGHIEVDGYITKPLSARPNRNMQFFFLNGRLVKSRTMMAAVEEAYKNNIMAGKYPGCVIRMSLNPSLCDVNVHPAKLEVRFSNEKEVFESVYYAVKNALNKNDERPTLEIEKNIPVNGSFFEEKKAGEFTLKKSPFAANASYNFKNESNTAGDEQLKIILKNTPLAPESEETVPLKNNTAAVYEPYKSGRVEVYEKTAPVKKGFTSNISAFPKENVENSALPNRKTEPEMPKNEQTVSNIEAPVKAVGECFGTYIIAEKGESLYIIDKHAAHERILYERVKKGRSEESQMLLEPVSVKLSADEYSAVISNLSLLEKAGISAEDFGNSTVIVRSAPLDLAGRDINDLISETAGLLIAHAKDIIPAKLDWIFHSVACRAAVKAHDRTTLPEMQSLAEKILNSKDIMYCPHGRPVAFELKKSALEKKFGRV